jgi:hypothetical protein
MRRLNERRRRHVIAMSSSFRRRRHFVAMSSSFRRRRRKNKRNKACVAENCITFAKINAWRVFLARKYLHSRRFRLVRNTGN